MKSLFLPLVLIFSAALSFGQEVKTDNVSDFDTETNEIAPGRWAYGWFGRGKVTDPRMSLRLFTNSYPEEKVRGKNWTVDIRKAEAGWTIVQDGRTYTDGAEIVWIYQIPAKLAGKVAIRGSLERGGASRRMRVYKISDEFFSSEDRENLRPIYEGDGDAQALDFTLEALENELLLFIVDDTAEKPKWTNPSLLHVMIGNAP